MKITFDIDCTPQEARDFLGLPDVTNVNKMVMEHLQERAKENLDTLADPKQFIDNMMSASGNMQSAFFDILNNAGKTTK